jgi:hypothetical protein
MRGVVAKAAMGCAAITCLSAMLAMGQTLRSNPLRAEPAEPAAIFNPASAARQMSGATINAPSSIRQTNYADGETVGNTVMSDEHSQVMPLDDYTLTSSQDLAAACAGAGCGSHCGPRIPYVPYCTKQAPFAPSFYPCPYYPPCYSYSGQLHACSPCLCPPHCGQQAGPYTNGNEQAGSEQTEMQQPPVVKQTSGVKPSSKKYPVRQTSAAWGNDQAAVNPGDVVPPGNDAPMPPEDISRGNERSNGSMGNRSYGMNSQRMESNSCECTSGGSCCASDRCGSGEVRVCDQPCDCGTACRDCRCNNNCCGCPKCGCETGGCNACGCGRNCSGGYNNCSGPCCYNCDDSDIGNRWPWNCHWYPRDGACGAKGGCGLFETFGYDPCRTGRCLP